jgi:ketosteroid isomerase-like protein
MADGGLDQANRDVVERFFAASERGDAGEVAALTHDEMVMEWPQSGERFTGRANVLAAMAAVEVKPEFAGQPRLVGSGSVWVLMAPLRYGDEVLEYVAVLELEGGRIRHATGFWGAPFPAQAARAPYADRD